MKFSLSWLKQHLETQAPVSAISDALTMLGLEVEDVVDRGAAFADFVVAEVLEARPHPNADKLRVCIVDTGREHLQVVCGAANARAGMKGVFAPAGAYIPGSGMTLKPTSIRGIESLGMLLSEREMQLSDEHSGIVEIAADRALGTPAAEALGLADPVIDVAITPNRGDCLGVRGIARDLAAAGVGVLKPLDASPVPGTFQSWIGVKLSLTPETTSACPYFAGRLIRDVRNGESPDWLKNRLLAAGLRPISALVDITNYVALDLCRPLHVFDADRLAGGLHVRLARVGETLEALNGKTYALTPEMTVVADDSGAQALGGVIGGMMTACTETTRAVFVESAVFDPVRTAATGRALNVTSDARYRFERGIDACGVEPGLEIATRLILDLCGGDPSAVVVAGAPAPRRPSIAFRPARVRTLAGVDATVEACESALRALGFDGEMSGETWALDVPSWRNDVVGEACIVEEVVRVLGYDQIPTVPLPRQSTLPAPALSALQRRRSRARRTLASRGLTEAVTYSFVSGHAAASFAAANLERRECLRLINPISADLDVMRPSPLPGLILAAQRNADRGQRDAALFEVGPQYAGDSPTDQMIVAVAIRSGRTGHRHWAQQSRAVDVFDAKADAIAVLDALGVRTEKLIVTTDVPGWYHPGRAGTLSLGQGASLAWFGEISPRVLRRLQADSPFVACEIFVDVLPAAASGHPRPPLALPVLQQVERDFAFIVDVDVAAETVVRAVRSADRTLITDVRVFDVFYGAAVEAGKKSVALTVVMQPVEHTLTDTDIEAVSDRIVAHVGKAVGGLLRS